MPYFMISARTTPESEKTSQALRYLRSDDGKVYKALSHVSWVKEIVDHLQSDGNDTTEEILFFVHGFNVSQDSASKSHKQYCESLKAAGWYGLLISFDWPSAGLTFAYLPDREQARVTASRLISGGVSLLQKAQSRDCTIAVNLMCHSMGAFVAETAFDCAYQDVPPNWSVNQVLLVSADVGAGDMGIGKKSALSYEAHAGRVTSYTNRYDKALAVSNAKRLGLSPRLGRVGLPDQTPDLMCNVDCSALFDVVDSGLGAHLSPEKTHCFYFDQPVFWQDVVLTLGGGIDRNLIPTRQILTRNRFELKSDKLNKSDYKLALERADLNSDRGKRLA